MNENNQREADAHVAEPDFSALSPEAVINAVEGALGADCTNVCRPLSSYINRVYEVGLGAGGFVVAKFYRPGRWSRDALQDELDFLAELHAAEVPVVPPLPGRDGALLHALGHTQFAVFPKKGGRPLDEPGVDAWPSLGRLIGRMHAVGARHSPRDRITLHPDVATEMHLDFILDSNTIPEALREEYTWAVEDLIEHIGPLFDAVPMLRVHGDCHRANILHRPGEGFHLLDFDDMAVGPAVQDLWLILPDRLARARREMDGLLVGYDTFLEFPRETLSLIEPLRAMRYIHYTAWCALQKADGGFARLAPGWGTSEFWRQEIADLARQRQEIDDALDANR
ncbi:MAG: serine/threonine protein kinase [Verrucomicrobia bacterium]|nr:serine/threonine protein kinase [Verrucomicrobiota bacterium]